MGATLGVVERPVSQETSGEPHPGRPLARPMGGQHDRLLWEVLLKQVEANLETTRAMHVLAQRRICKESAMVLDRILYVDTRSAEAGADVGMQGEERGVSSSSVTEYTQRAWPCAGGSEDKQVAVNKTAVGTKRVPSVLELFAACKNAPSQSKGAKPQEVFASSGVDSRSIEKTVAVIAGTEAAAKKATANDPSQCEVAKHQEDFSTSESESRSSEKIVTDIAG